MTTQIKIYVANLGKYNEGELVGDWFTLPCDMKEIRVKIGVAHYNSDGEFVPYVAEDDNYYEEWAIHDYEAPFSIGEYDSIDRLNEIAEELNSINEPDEVVQTILENYDPEEAIEILQNSEYIVYSNCRDMADVAYEIIEMSCLLDGVNEVLRRYFDYDAYGRDLEIEGKFHQVDDNTYVEITR